MERRTRRSTRINEALNHFLKALCLKRGLEAAALTTEDGLLISGEGHGDLEEIGALGAMTHVPPRIGSRTLHVARFDVNDVPLCLTTLGAPVRDDAAIGSLMRILAV
ncbi:MAG: hypothetical protein IPJ65_30810 [Archangiaceae bacterium]|nr:hypothetical protein [Archangiaceae bacterium]